MIFVFSAIIVALIFYNFYSRDKAETEKTLLNLEKKKLQNLRLHPKLNENYNKAIWVLDSIKDEFSNCELNTNQFHFQKTRDEANRLFGQGYIGNNKHLSIEFNISPNFFYCKLKISKNFKPFLNESLNYEGQNIPNQTIIVSKILTQISKTK